MGPPENRTAARTGILSGGNSRNAVTTRAYQIRAKIATDVNPKPEPALLWHAFATHGGGRCSHYVGDYRTALIEALRYKRTFGGRVHLEVCR